MKRIELQTFIQAPAERCFLLALSVDLHLLTGKETGERVAEGRETGILREGECITWEARHAGMKRRMQVQVSAFDLPRSFFSRQVKGPFRFLEHVHLFEAKEGGTMMKDVFEFAAPFGILGKIAETLFLEKHLRGFLARRNDTIRRVAEGNLWVYYLKNTNYETLPDSEVA